MRPFPGKTDCVILDFVDASSVPLVTLPTLFGMPRDFDFEGRDASEGKRAWDEALSSTPGLEVEPGTITLGEIQRRAAAFDPLTLKVDAEVATISQNGWTSLGSRGLALHVDRREHLVLARGLRRSDRYHVLIDGKKVAHFARLEEAVEAVDHEVSNRGRWAEEAALPDAPWRKEPVAARLAARLAALKPPRVARNTGEALALLCFAMHGPGSPRPKP